MKPFPVMAAMFLMLGSMISFFMGGWIFLASIFTNLPHLGLFFLVFSGNLLLLQGGIYWGFCFFEPQILIIQEGVKKDKHYLVNGVIIFLWSCFALFVGSMNHLKEGYFLEILGFIGVLMMDRFFQRQMLLPAGYYRLKSVFTFFVILGLLGGFFAP